MNEFKGTSNRTTMSTETPDILRTTSDTFNNNNGGKSSHDHQQLFYRLVINRGIFRIFWICFEFMGFLLKIMEYLGFIGIIGFCFGINLIYFEIYLGYI